MVQVAEGMRQAGRLAESENLWRQMLVDFPDQPQPYVGLGALLMQANRHGEAYELYKKAATIAPHEFIVWRHFGLCLIELRQHEAATIAFKKAIALRPSHNDTLHDLANAHFLSGQIEDAFKAYDRLTELEPDLAAAHLGRGVQLQSLGRFEEAKASLNRAIELNPKETFAHFRMASMDHTAQEAKELLARSEALANSEDFPAQERAAIWFSSAHILRNQQDYDRAFEHYTTANTLLREEHRFDRKGFKWWIDATIDGYTPETFEVLKDAGSPSTSPIFIVGMPRSGTTLVETIVSSHPGVTAGGEERKMADLVEALGKTKGEIKYPREAASIKPAHMLPFGTQYLSHMARLHPGAKRTTDKMPFNCLHLGLIAVLFPQATIIHCRRDPLDTCLSCYFQYFAEGEMLSFTNDLGDLGYLYTEYERLMAHWHEVLPTRIMDVQYEELVASQETVIRQLIAHAGLDWDDACLGFHQQDRAVKTASQFQVRQPIYNSAVERWRKYESHLGPLREALESAA